MKDKMDIVDRLRVLPDSREDAIKFRDAAIAEITRLRSQLAAKTQECQELRKDAERYRHFRKAIMSEETSLLNEDEFDAAIDTAIKEAK